MATCYLKTLIKYRGNYNFGFKEDLSGKIYPEIVKKNSSAQVL